MGAHRFEPSDASFYGAPAENAGGGLLDLVQDAFTSSNAAIAGWGALITAIEDPRERVATLKAKIANYERMRRKYGIGPLGDLYDNEIRLMKARLRAEKKGLVIQKEGEGAVWVWRLAAWGVAGAVALLLAAKAYAAVTSAPGTARVTNPGGWPIVPVGDAFPEGAVIDYDHADWGRSRGRVLRNDGPKGRELLIQDYAKGGGREWVGAGDAEPRRRNPAGGRAGSTTNRQEVDDLLTWLRTADDRQRIAAEMLEQYDADPNMGRDSGVRFTLREWARVKNPRVTMDDVDPRERFQLASVPDGWAEVKDGRDRQAYKKWALCASRDGKKPLKRYTNGGPVGLLRPTSGKTERGPLWHHRAQGFVRLVGGLPLPGLYDVASWYSRHRAGTYPLTVD